MKKILTLFLIVVAMYANAQDTSFDKMLKEMYKYSVPLVKSSQLSEWMKEGDIYILDAREGKEFKISHIKGAIEVGYDKFDIEKIPSNISKEAKVVIYCSVGYRSERIGEKMMHAGYSNVFNLYGGIFDWTNHGNKVYNEDGEVKEVHAYNKDWGKWVQNDNIKKVY